MALSRLSKENKSQPLVSSNFQTDQHTLINDKSPSSALNPSIREKGKKILLLNDSSHANTSTSASYLPSSSNHQSVTLASLLNEKSNPSHAPNLTTLLPSPISMQEKISNSNTHPLPQNQIPPSLEIILKIDPPSNPLPVPSFIPDNLSPHCEPFLLLPTIYNSFKPIAENQPLQLPDGRESQPVEFNESQHLQPH